MALQTLIPMQQQSMVKPMTVGLPLARPQMRTQVQQLLDVARLENQQLQQYIRTLQAQKLERDLEAGGPKGLERLAKTERINAAFNELMQNEDFVTRARSVINASPTRQLKVFDELRAEYLEPMHTRYDVSTSDLVNDLFGPTIARAKAQQKVIDDSAWEAIPKNLYLGTMEAWDAVKNLAPWVNEEEVAKEQQARRKAVVEISPYLKDQQQRAEEGESFFSRTNGLSGWLNMAAEQAPVLASFVVPGGIARGIATKLGSTALRAANIGRGVNVGGGAAMGSSLSSIDYTNSILNDPNLTPEEKQAALDSWQRMGVRVLGGVTGALAPDAGHWLRMARNTRFFNPAVADMVRAGDTAGVNAFRQQTALQALVNQSRQSAVGQALRGVRDMGAGMAAMNAAQRFGTNMLRNSATGQDTPLLTGVGEAAAMGAITGGLLGAGARALHRVPPLRDDGTPLPTPQQYAYDYMQRTTPETRDAAIRTMAAENQHSNDVLRQFFEANKGKLTEDEQSHIRKVYQEKPTQAQPEVQAKGKSKKQKTQQPQQQAQAQEQPQQQAQQQDATPSAADAALQEEMLKNYSNAEPGDARAETLRLFEKMNPGKTIVEEDGVAIIRDKVAVVPTAQNAAQTPESQSVNARAIPAAETVNAQAEPKANLTPVNLKGVKFGEDTNAAPKESTEIVPTNGKEGSNATPGDPLANGSGMAANPTANAAKSTLNYTQTLVPGDPTAEGRGNGGSKTQTLGQDEANLGADEKPAGEGTGKKRIKLQQPPESDAVGGPKQTDGAGKSVDTSNRRPGDVSPVEDTSRANTHSLTDLPIATKAELKSLYIRKKNAGLEATRQSVEADVKAIIESKIPADFDAGNERDAAIAQRMKVLQERNMTEEQAYRVAKAEEYVRTFRQVPEHDALAGIWRAKTDDAKLERILFGDMYNKIEESANNPNAVVEFKGYSAVGNPEYTTDMISEIKNRIDADKKNVQNYRNLQFAEQDGTALEGRRDAYNDYKDVWDNLPDKAKAAIGNTYAIIDKMDTNLPANVQTELLSQYRVKNLAELRGQILKPVAKKYNFVVCE